MNLKQKGIILIAILIVISTLTIILVNSKLDKSYQERVRYARSIGFSIQTFYEEHGSLPVNLDQLDSGSQILIRLFENNLTYTRQSEHSAVLEEREEKWVKIFKKRRIVKYLGGQ